MADSRDPLTSPESDVLGTTSDLLTPFGRRDAPSPASGRRPAIPGLGHDSLPPAGSGDPSTRFRLRPAGFAVTSRSLGMTTSRYAVPSG